MNVFIEKEFIENFEIEYEDNLHILEWKLLFVLFTEYSNINWFLNSTDEDYEKVIEASKLLTLFSDNNPRMNVYSDLKNEIQKSHSIQTLVFTEENKDWLNEIDYQTILHFTYSNFANKLSVFINKNHLELDLSDKEIEFNWNSFHFLSENSNIIFITDPYILKDNDGQKIKHNLIPLLNNNLNKKNNYKVFIISELSDINIDKKLQILNSGLANLNVTIFLINRIKRLETMVLHDRLLYTNYTITTSGIGFNIKSNKPINSDVVTNTIFHKKTYKKFINHFRLISKYIDKLEKYTDFSKTFKTNTGKMYKEYRNLNII